MKPVRPFVILKLLGLVAWSLPASAQQLPDQLIELKAEGARVFAASRAQALAPPAATPAAAVRAFLTAQGKSVRALDTMTQTAEWRNAQTGMTHVRYGQSIGGLDVYGTYVKAALNARGELVHLIEILPEPPAAVTRSNVAARAALEAAIRELYPNRGIRLTELPAEGNTVPFREEDGFLSGNPTATRVLLPLATGVMQEGWLVETWTREDNQLHHTVVGNGARVMATELRTANDTYKVFVEHPSVTLDGTVRGAPQAVVSGPGTGNTESPKGWISADGQTGGKQYQFRMSGNNVDAYLDTDKNNSPDSAGTLLTGTDFLATAVLTDAPSTPVNKQVAIQNLFWANNTIHDKLYKYGFTEAAGNFQENNLGKGGLGSDSVLAEAQDGSGTNNANFSTPSDGSNPRMQMFLWTQTNPYRDGDVDTDIVYHEYGHGLTWRMVGSMSGCMSGAVGEGASDTLSLLMNGDDVVGEYSYNKATGIRRWPYDGYSFTYGQLTNEGVHAAGEILGAAMWRVKKSLGDEAAWTYFVGGLNLAPAGPKFEHIRDAMVTAAGGLTADGCKIYKAFAEVGVGQGASGSCKVTGFIFTTTTWTVTQSFAVPLACQNPVTDLAVTELTAPASVEPGTPSSIGVTVKNVGNQNVSGNIGVQLLENGTVISTGSITNTTLAPGGLLTHTFTWTPTTPGTVNLKGEHLYGDGSPGNNSISKDVTVATAPAITLTGTAVVIKGKKYADLTWSPPKDTANVDILKNGVLLVNTANDGFYRDGPQAKGVTLATYQVCAGTSCSNVVQVDW